MCGKAFPFKHRHLAKDFTGAEDMGNLLFAVRGNLKDINTSGNDYIKTCGFDPFKKYGLRLFIEMTS